MAIPHRLSTTEAVARKPTPSADSATGPAPGSSMDADAVAIRAIARYNVERRQAGEAPLDLKGIERLRHIVTETIDRYEVLKKTKPTEAH